MLWLKSMGAHVGAYSLEPPGHPSLWELACVEKDVTRLGGDVRDEQKLTCAVRKFAPEIVIHMAAQSLVRPSYADPLTTFSTNVMGTANVLEAVRHTTGVQAVINVTSDKCYKNSGKRVAFCETAPMGGRDPYSASKGCAEIVAESYRQSYFASSETAVASVRAGNVIGGGDFARDRLIPDMVRAFIRGKAVSIRCPDAIRPWQHVLDPLAGYLSLAKALCEAGQEYSGGWNFGPDADSALTVSDVVTCFARLWGDGAAALLDEQQHPYEAECLILNCSKARDVLGWQSKAGFPEAIELVAQWYKGWNDGVDARRLTLDQICQFEELL